MNNHLLIVGAGIYAVVASEIAREMGCFDKIDFLDDSKKETPNGIAVLGTFADVRQLAAEYSSIVVAIGNPEVRLSLLQRAEAETGLSIATLISPRAYIAPSAQIEKGSIVEPMAVVHSCAVIERGCIISAGAVVNHASVCEPGVHVDCNGTVAGNLRVPAKRKIKSGQVFDGRPDSTNSQECL